MFCVAVWAEFNAPQPLFGMELRSHLERSCRDIARVLEDCVSALLEYGMEEEVSVMLSIKSITAPDYLLLLHQTHERTNTASATASFMLAFSRPYLYVKFLLYH